MLVRFVDKLSSFDNEVNPNAFLKAATLPLPLHHEDTLRRIYETSKTIKLVKGKKIELGQNTKSLINSRCYTSPH